MVGQINHQPEAEHRDGKQRDARDAGCDRRLEQGQQDQRGKKGKPAERDVGISHVPAVEIEVGEQKYDQGGCEDGLARRAPDLLRIWREREYLAPEAEIDADVDQHRPA